DRFPTGGLEWKFGRRRVALRCARAGSAALPLCKGGRGTNGHGDPERGQQLTARKPATIESSEQCRKVGTHRRLLRNPRWKFSTQSMHRHRPLKELTAVSSMMDIISIMEDAGSDLNRRITDRVRELRAAQGLSLEGLASKSGVS